MSCLHIVSLEERVNREMDERPYQAGPSSGHDRNSLNVNKPIGAGVSVIETPMGLRRLMESDGRDFSGFREEKGTMRRVITVEQEMRNMRVDRGYTSKAR